VGHLGHEKSPAGDIQQTGYWPGSQLKVPASLTVGLPNTPWLKSARQLVATIDALSAVIVGLYRRFIMDASPWRQPATTIGRQSAVQSWLPVYLCSSVIIVGEVNVVDFDWASGHNGWVEGKVVVTGPPPLCGLLDQTLPDRVHVHVLQPLSEFLGMADKPIPELVLPA